jgi:hypothetical protein
MARSTVAAVLEPGAIRWRQPSVGQCNQLQIESGLRLTSDKESVPMRAQGHRWDKGGTRHYRARSG